jgi:ribosomal protein S27E
MLTKGQEALHDKQDRSRANGDFLSVQQHDCANEVFDTVQHTPNES